LREGFPWDTLGIIEGLDMRKIVAAKLKAETAARLYELALARGISVNALLKGLILKELNIQEAEEDRDDGRGRDV
jgi:hypothetical protein